MGRAGGALFALALAAPAAAQAPGDQIAFTCLIEPSEVIDLSAPVAGIIAELPIDRGDAIAAGDLVARLDTRLDDIRVRRAEARAANAFSVGAREARAAFLAQKAERMRALAERDIAASAAYDEAAMEAEAARQEVEEARLDIALAEIEAQEAAAIRAQKIVRSPADGVVVERRASVGEYQDGTEPIVTLARLDPLRVETFVPIALYPELSVGQAVTIEPEAPIGGRFPAEIAVIDQVFDAGTGTVGVRIDLPNPDHALPAGQRCQVRFSGS